MFMSKFVSTLLCLSNVVYATVMSNQFNAQTTSVHAEVIDSSSINAISKLDRIHGKLISVDDCHGEVKSKLIEYQDSGSCQDECVKLQLSIILSNCILAHQRFNPIECGILSNCVLQEGCVTEDGEGFAVSTSDQLKSKKKSKFNKPTQQSIIFSQAYSYIDEASQEATEESLAVVRDIQATGSRTYETLLGVETISKATLENGVKSLEHIGIIVNVTQKNLEVSLESASLLSQTMDMISANLAMTHEIKRTSEEHREMLITTGLKIDVANIRLGQSINMVDTIRQHIESIKCLVRSVCMLLLALCVMLLTLVMIRKFLVFKWIPSQIMTKFDVGRNPRDSPMEDKNHDEEGDELVCASAKKKERSLNLTNEIDSSDMVRVPRLVTQSDSSVRLGESVTLSNKRPRDEEKIPNRTKQMRQ